METGLARSGLLLGLVEQAEAPFRDVYLPQVSSEYRFLEVPIDWDEDQPRQHDLALVPTRPWPQLCGLRQGTRSRIPCAWWVMSSPTMRGASSIARSPSAIPADHALAVKKPSLVTQPTSSEYMQTPSPSTPRWASAGVPNPAQLTSTPWPLQAVLCGSAVQPHRDPDGCLRCCAASCCPPCSSRRPWKRRRWSSSSDWNNPGRRACAGRRPWALAPMLGLLFAVIEELSSRQRGGPRRAGSTRMPRTLIELIPYLLLPDHSVAAFRGHGGNPVPLEELLPRVAVLRGRARPRLPEPHYTPSPRRPKRARQAHRPGPAGQRRQPLHDRWRDQLLPDTIVAHIKFSHHYNLPLPQETTPKRLLTGLLRQQPIIQLPGGDPLTLSTSGSTHQRAPLIDRTGPHSPSV